MGAGSRFHQETGTLYNASWDAMIAISASLAGYLIE
jgi:hypothetical protein